MHKNCGTLVLGTIALVVVIDTSRAEPQNSSDQISSGPQLQEVVVTSRKLTENLQDVPDAISVVTGAQIASFGIKTVDDVTNVIPNLFFHSGDAFEPGTFAITMRGIGSAVGGWPSVSYTVDGVPQVTTDSIQQGSLEDIDRIEVLRGPQSALYGFNAIGGAINVITKDPTNDFRYSADVLYGNGADRQLGGVISGPIIPDELLFRFGANYRDDDGLIRSASNGLDLDFKQWKQLRAKLLFTPESNLRITIFGNWDKERNGATYQDKVPSLDDQDNFSSVFNARRAVAGYQDRTLYTTAVHLQWDLDHISIISTIGFNHINEINNSSVCYDDPQDPVVPAPGGGILCLLGPAYGLAATPGETVDEGYYEEKLFKTITSDARIASRGFESFDASLGISTMHRDSSQGYKFYDIIAPDSGSTVLFPNWNVLKDEWWGVYGQLVYHVTPRLDVTAAARYDHETYKNTEYTDQSFSVVVPVYQNGILTNTQRESAHPFEPKGQLSYHFTDNNMGYLTVSRGFRSGFFEFSLYTLPEHTTNYELGLKSTLWEHRFTSNAAVFYTDYADQQYFTYIPTPPYAATLTIPKTSIKGVEYEATVLASRFMTLGTSLGYLNTEVANGGGWSPNTPRFNATTYVDFTLPLQQDWKARLHIDDRYNSLQYLGTGNTSPNPAKNFANIRAGIQNAHYDIAAFVRNVTDRREQTQAAAPDGNGFARYQNLPRSYGVEMRFTF